jgi:hypothetical protein
MLIASSRREENLFMIIKQKDDFLAVQQRSELASKDQQISHL